MDDARKETSDKKKYGQAIKQKKLVRPSTKKAIKQKNLVKAWQKTLSLAGILFRKVNYKIWHQDKTIFYSHSQLFSHILYEALRFANDNEPVQQALRSFHQVKAVSTIV